MCTCIVGIKASYTVVEQETSRIAQKSFKKAEKLMTNENFDMDDFLDAINLATKELHQLIQSINRLVEVVRNNFCDITPSEAKDLLQLSQPIQRKMQLLQSKLLASPLHRGMQTSIELYSDAKSDFDELCQDLKTLRIDLEQNGDFQRTLNEIDEMLKK